MQRFTDPLAGPSQHFQSGPSRLSLSRNHAQMYPQLSVIDVTTKTFFERMYLDLGLRKIAP